MKELLEMILAALARRIIQKYKPIVIGITGSVGKTSTREAVFSVVNQRFNARKSPKNFNNELGLPLTIIGAQTLPEKNIIAWLGILFQALTLIILKRPYPELLVLEMGIDHPGDMEYLLSIARPHIAILTSIGISHYAYFQDVEILEKEKGKIGSHLSALDFFVVNADNAAVMRQAGLSRGAVISYGIENEQAAVRSLRIDEHYTDRPYSAIEVRYSGAEATSVEIVAIGKPHVYAALAAVACAQALNMDFSSVHKGLKLYRPTPGRLTVIEGIKHSRIIDDSYNAAPDSMKEALGLLERFPAQHKMAVLGDMRELGNMTEAAHREIGTRVGNMHIDELITVGPNARMYAEEAIAIGMDGGRVTSFATADEAKKFVQERLQPESLVLVKGSQNTIRLEKVVLEIMAEPMRAHELLCRQDEVWQRS